MSRQGTLLRSLAILFIASVTTGCASMQRDAEAVYLQQHQVSAALTEAIFTAEPENQDLVDRLYGAESELREACSALQQVGYRKYTNEPIDSFLALNAFASVDHCAAKTAEVARLIRLVDSAAAAAWFEDGDFHRAQANAVRISAIGASPGRRR